MSAIGRNRNHRFSLNIRLATGAALVGVWWGLQHLPVRPDGSIGGVGDVCLFRNLTDLPCPLCGMTRSLLCFIQGNWSDTLRWHPLGVLFGIIITSTLLCWIVGGINVLSKAATFWPKATRPCGIIAIVVFGGTWLLRLYGIWPLPPSP